MRPRRTTAALATATVAVTITALGVAPTAASAAPTDLFISEYVEGSSNNKAIELFNGTGAAVDLTAGGYQLQLYFNGSTTATTIALTGSVAAGDAFVFASASAGAGHPRPGRPDHRGEPVQRRRRRSCCAGAPQCSTRSVRWASTRAPSGVPASTSTADNTLRRLPSVTAGDTDPSDAFDPAAQWAGLPVDTFDGLGTHTVDGGGPVDVPATLTCGGPLVTAGGHGREPRGHRHRSGRHDRRPGGDRGQPDPDHRLDHPYRVHPGRRGGRHRPRHGRRERRPHRRGVHRHRDRDRRGRWHRELRVGRAGDPGADRRRGAGPDHRRRVRPRPTGRRSHRRAATARAARCTTYAA